jgi:predicted nucleic acid-binding protein
VALTTSESALVDTSVAVALSSQDHDFYESTRDALAGVTLGLSGHALFETYSTLTRMPPPFRRSAHEVKAFTDERFPETRMLSVSSAAKLYVRMVSDGIVGGSVWDGLVGACALEHGMKLASRDRQAVSTYQALGIDVVILP